MKKLSELKDEELLFVCSKDNYDGSLVTKNDILNKLDYYKDKVKTDNKFEIYTTYKVHAYLNARDILSQAIEDEECDSMYEDWKYRILEDIEEEEIQTIQSVLDKILLKNPTQNIAYHHDKLVELDL